MVRRGRRIYCPLSAKPEREAVMNHPDSNRPNRLRAARLITLLSLQALGATALAQTDSDGDGLSDLEEEQLATFPDLADSDRDGLSDWREVAMENTDPLNVDTDGDGLTDSEELLRFLTNPNNADSDGDSNSDFIELTIGSDPWDAQSSAGDGVDPDGDGVGQSLEDALALNPFSPDSDGGGQMDGWEILNGMDPRNSLDDFVDSDGDGVVDEYERLIGLDPDNSNDGGGIAGYLLLLPDDVLMDADRDSIPAGSDSPYAGEFLADVNPFSSDSDGDGLSDSVEALPFELTDLIRTYFEIPDHYLIRHATDPLKADTDGDGIDDKEELVELHTNPVKADTDEGGVPDGTELRIGIDPLDPADDDFPDDDSDGLPNSMEAQYRSDPMNPDTDGDGLLDGAEVFVYETLPHIADSDGGGASDGLEVSRGTDPLDRSDDDLSTDVIPPVFEQTETLVVWVFDGDSTELAYTLPIATDDMDPDPVVSCIPAPGTLFSVGETEVSCTAIDDSGNVGYGGFYVYVRIPHAPVAESQNIATDEDTSVDFTLTGTDLDGDELFFSISQYPEVGAISGSIPNLTYTPPPNFSGPVLLSFLVSDQFFQSEPGIVQISVLAVNDAPTAADDSTSVLENSIYNVVNVLENDTDVEFGELTIVSVSDPPNGTAVIAQSGGVVEYTPDSEFVGTDTFVYEVSDFGGAVGSATVEVTVIADTDGDGVPDRDDPDDDGDGIQDNVDTMPLEKSTFFDDRPIGGRTFGSVQNFSEASPVRISRSSLTDSIVIEADADKGGAAIVSICGGLSQYFVGPPSNTRFMVACGSEIVAVEEGRVDATLVADSGAQTVLSVPAGYGLVFEPSTGSIAAAPANPGALTAFVAGQSIEIAAGRAVQSIGVTVEQGTINLKANGVIPVALLGSEQFRAASVLPESVVINGAGVKIVGRSDKSLCSADEDINLDGFPDLVCQVLVDEWDQSLGYTNALLVAATASGVTVFGATTIHVN